MNECPLLTLARFQVTLPLLWLLNPVSEINYRMPTGQQPAWLGTQMNITGDRGVEIGPSCLKENTCGDMIMLPQYVKN